MAIDPDRSGVIIGAELDPGDIRKEDAGSAWIRLDDDVSKLLRRLKPRLRRHCRVKHLSLRLGHPADLTRSDLDILVLNRGNDVARHELQALQLGRIEPD